MKKNDSEDRLDPPEIWCVIPVYNSAGEASRVARESRRLMDRVMVVDDGSTDADLKTVLQDADITVLRHEQNMGKGAALATALHVVKEQGGTHMITLDGDGQHDPADLPALVERIHTRPDAVVVGCRDFHTPNVPDGSKFGRVFSNLWIRMETGASLHDTQSGFRAYPVRLISRLPLSGRYYDFEIEVLTRALWAGLPIEEVPVRVHYPPPEKRITHFRPFWDNARISLMHTRLVGRRLVPWPHRKLVPQKDRISAWYLLCHPLRSVRMLLKEHASPAGLAAAAGVGTVLAVLPFIACHTLVILYASARLHLNKVMAVSIQHIYAPPLVPFLCVELGYFLRHGEWWTEFSRETIVHNLHQRLLEWLIGSLVLAPVFAVLAAAITYGIAAALQRRSLARAAAEGA